MEPTDFTEVTPARAMQLFKVCGTYINQVNFSNARQHLYSVENFYVEYIDYGDNSFDVFSYYDDDPRLDKFLRKVDLRDYL